MVISKGLRGGNGKRLVTGIRLINAGDLMHNRGLYLKCNTVVKHSLSHTQRELCVVMDVFINLIVGIIVQSVCVSNHCTY